MHLTPSSILEIIKLVKLYQSYNYDQYSEINKLVVVVSLPFSFLSVVILFCFFYLQFFSNFSLLLSLFLIHEYCNL